PISHTGSKSWRSKICNGIRPTTPPGGRGCRPARSRTLAWQPSRRWRTHRTARGCTSWLERTACICSPRHSTRTTATWRRYEPEASCLDPGRPHNGKIQRVVAGQAVGYVLGQGCRVHQAGAALSGNGRNDREALALEEDHAVDLGRHPVHCDELHTGPFRSAADVGTIDINQ